MAEYYVVKDKNTGLYFRGKGVNRWGKYYNQASVYRVRANAENTIKEVSWRGEQAEVVPIQIIESTADVVPKSEYDEVLSSWQKIHDSYDADCIEHYKYGRAEVAREIFEEIEKMLIDSTHIPDCARFVDIDKLAELKKKYTEGENEDQRGSN